MDLTQKYTPLPGLSSRSAQDCACAQSWAKYSRGPPGLPGFGREQTYSMGSVLRGSWPRKKRGSPGEELPGDRLVLVIAARLPEDALNDLPFAIGESDSAIVTLEAAPGE